MNSAKVENQIYADNLAWISTKTPHFLENLVDFDGESGPYFIEKAKNGALTMGLHTERGKRYFHSRYDPLEEARSLVEGLDRRLRLEYEVIGCGLGYHIDEIIKGKIESLNVFFFSTAEAYLLLSNRDISHWFNVPRVNFFLIDELIQKGRFDHIGTENVYARPLLVDYRPISLIFSDKRDKLIVLIKKAIDAYLPLINTKVSRNYLMLRNNIINFPYYAKTSGIEKWLGLFKGMPAICISGGPSLSKSYGLLKKAKGKAVLIAIGTTLQPLLYHDIIPDFVMVLDYSEANKGHFEGLDPNKLRDTVLIADVSTYYEVIKDWPGRLSVTASQPIFPETVRRKGMLQQGTTVAHSAVLFAGQIGADPIILVGQDLSYPDMTRSHADGTAYVRNLKLVYDRMHNPMIMHYDETNPHHKPIYTSARWVEGVDGGKVLTDLPLLNFLVLFERLIELHCLHVIDAKERGAKIRGTAHMPLPEVLERYCTRCLPITEKVREIDKYTAVLFDRPLFNKKLKETMNALREIASLSKSLLGLCRRLHERLIIEKRPLSNADKAKINQRLDKLFSEERFHIIKILQDKMLAGVMLEISRYLKAEDVSDKDRLETIMAFLDAMRMASSDLLKDFEDVLGLYKKEGLIDEV